MNVIQWFRSGLVLMMSISASSVWAENKAVSTVDEIKAVSTVDEIKAGLLMEFQEMEGLHCHSDFAEWKTSVPELDLNIDKDWQEQLSEFVSQSSDVESVFQERSLLFTVTPESGVLKGLVVKVLVGVDKLGVTIQRLTVQIFEKTKVNVGTLFKPQFTTELKLQRRLKCNWNYRS